MVRESPTIDPQEYLVVNNQGDPKSYNILWDGVTPIMQDAVGGYSYSVMNTETSTVITKLSFSNNGYLYYFEINGLVGSYETEDIHRVVNSIKFF